MQASFCSVQNTPWVEEPNDNNGNNSNHRNVNNNENGENDNMGTSTENKEKLNSEILVGNS